MSHPKSYDISPYYILLGCIIDERYQADLEQHANHIKFKYWGRTDVVFHSADMAHSTAAFEIFQNDESKKSEFMKDLLDMLNKAPLNITAAVIDKEKAFNSFWEERTVIKRSAEIVLYNFLAYIYTKMPCRGKIIIEASSMERDTQYLAAFNALLHPSFGIKNPLYKNAGVRDHLTSINFVTKQNHDIEAQVADLLAYGVRCGFNDLAAYKKSSYEYRIIKVANSKLIKMAPTMGDDKRKFFKLIDAVKIIPTRTRGIKRSKEKRG